MSKERFYQLIEARGITRERIDFVLKKYGFDETALGELYQHIVANDADKSKSATAGTKYKGASSGKSWATAMADFKTARAELQQTLEKFKQAEKPVYDPVFPGLAVPYVEQFPIERDHEGLPKYDPAWPGAHVPLPEYVKEMYRMKKARGERI